MDRDLYEVLGVERSADQDSIKKAYRKLAMKYHPDQNPGDKAAEEKFNEAARAYEVLSNTEKRSRYDRFGMAGVDGMRGGPGAGGFQDVHDIFNSFGDIFGDFFGGMGGQQQGRRQSRPRRGSDLRYVVEIELKDVFEGIKKSIEFDIEENCSTCNGSRAAPGSKAEVCGMCRGSGQVFRQQGFFSVGTTCPTCRGAGESIKDPCKDCKGRGRKPVHRKLEVNIPAGVGTGTQLRMSGEGEPGFLGGPAGDLYVEIHVQPHDEFEREDDHLIGRIEISYLKALLGGEEEVETLKGKETLTIPKGTASGDVIRLQGKGLPSLRSARRGDLIFEVEVLIPKKLDKKEEQLLRQIAEHKGEAVSEGKPGIFNRK